jgi:O-antigen/teichoic acid export membrane protein
MQPLKALTLRQNFSWTFAGNMVYAAAQWGMLVVLAKLGSPEMVGQFTLGLAVTAPIILLAGLQLRQIQVTDVKQQYTFGDYLGLRLICTTVSLLAIAIITFFAHYPPQTSLVILVIGLSKAVESISDIFHGLFQYNERMDRIAFSLIIKGLLSLLALAIGVYVSGNALGGAIGLTTVWTLVLVLYDIPSSFLIAKAALRREELLTKETTDFPATSPVLQLRPRFNASALRRLITLSLPLGFVMMLISLNANIPRYFIEHHLGVRELGIFSALSYLIVAGGIVVNALGQSASPRLAKYFAAGNRQDFQSLLFKLFLIGLLLGGVAILMAALAGKEILTILYRPEYAQQAYLFILLMVAAGIGYVASFLGYAMTAAQYFRVQMPLFTVVTGISALACFWLIPTQGLVGAAIALIIGAMVQAIFSLGVIYYALQKLDGPTSSTGIDPFK